ncbi:Carboxylesterase NlhH [Vibrio aerogenes CECT 7868]|uniref:Carboxylesterase NlhH n=1 Tax=Vibrio aerogenes CECT 7868 TaxID=1216006 RepID=A0A1M6A1E4_9VIBR|nr:alpha/beta hydrolase [Vibrio aerogenes]SHI30312.1 Carboxylesterase NlhH [Vibrio aerogenes CECT 7868]
MINKQPGHHSLSDIIEPVCGTEGFPESHVFAEGIEVLPASDAEMCCRIHFSVPYITRDSGPLHLHIIEPKQYTDEPETYPLVLYVQGSAWLEQDTGSQVAQLAWFARRGFVIAVVEYRPSTVAPFPAQVIDTKAAVRFMVQHACDYHADPQQLFLWGDSSGAHTALMAAFSQQDEALDECHPAQLPAQVRGVIDYYGPTDISKMSNEPSVLDHTAADSPEGLLIGGVRPADHPALVRPTVPMNYIVKSHDIPPVLIFHGSQDRIVPFGQSVLLYEALKQNDKEVSCYQLKGADHGGEAFWQSHILNIVETFVRRCL